MKSSKPRRQRGSLRWRLMIISAATTFVAITSSGIALSLLELVEQRQAFDANLKIRSAVITASLEAAVDFEDAQVARESLQHLEADPYVTMAAVYTSSGALLAHYPNSTPPPVGVPDFGSTENKMCRTLVVPIDSRPGAPATGRLSLEYDLSPMYKTIGRRLRILGGTLFSALLLSMLLSFRLQSSITRPIHDLVSAAEVVKEKQDFSVRAPVAAAGEIGMLTDSFNNMLAHLQERDGQLQQHRSELEVRVADRTDRLHKALKEAEAANRAKTDFLANMSHEIRTPMTAILGYAELLLDDDHNESERLNASRVIERNGKHLMTVINDILDISKIEAGQMTVEMIPCQLSQILNEVISLLGHRAREKGLRLEVEERGSLPRLLRTDPTRLRQILLNLTGNAVKFTEKGSVRLIAEAWPSDETDDAVWRLRVMVSDTGIGLSPDARQKLFRPFSQADETMTRRFGGTGLGLAISKSLSELLGGSLEVESEEGVGSTFTVEVCGGLVSDRELQMTHSQVIRKKSASKGFSTPTRILLVEDGPDNQRLIRHLLVRAGADVEIAADGQVGLEAAMDAWKSDKPFDVVLMDMQMPVLDGYQATRRLRSARYPGSIIALTAHAMDGDRSRCLEAGCDDYTTKPVNRSELIEKIRQWKSRDTVDAAS